MAPTRGSLALARVLTGARPSSHRNHAAVMRLRGTEHQASTSSGVCLSASSQSLRSICCRVAFTDRVRVATRARARPRAAKDRSPVEARARPASRTPRGGRSTLWKGCPRSSMTHTVMTGVVFPTISTKPAEERSRAMLFVPVERACNSAIGKKKVPSCCRVGQRTEDCAKGSAVNATSPAHTKWHRVRKTGKGKWSTSCTSLTDNCIVERAAT
mmetsp:Transcript_50313/g.133036  ORF Transcript_50313/g.133036 Transcript_50313/m.133036 type:complete len:214 (-) Transcript_50313:593-1234(-)